MATQLTLPQKHNGESDALEDFLVLTSTLGCDLNNNKRGFSLPNFCILSDGVTFEFFKFERNGSDSSFFRGCFPGDPILLQRGLTSPTTDSPLPFILQLCCVCETVFDVMLSAYIHALNAYHGSRLCQIFANIFFEYKQQCLPTLLS
jgi:hypothetical protein